MAFSSGPARKKQMLTRNVTIVRAHARISGNLGLRARRQANSIEIAAPVINPNTMKTEVRFIRAGSDYHKLARFLETRTDKIVEWAPGRRTER